MRHSRKFPFSLIVTFLLLWRGKIYIFSVPVRFFYSFQEFKLKGLYYLEINIFWNNFIPEISQKTKQKWNKRFIASNESHTVDDDNTTPEGEWCWWKDEKKLFIIVNKIRFYLRNWNWCRTSSSHNVQHPTSSYEYKWDKREQKCVAFVYVY